MESFDRLRDTNINEEEFESLELDGFTHSDLLVPISGEIDDIARSPLLYEDSQVEAKPTHRIEWPEERLNHLEAMVERHQKNWWKIGKEFPGIKIKELKSRWKERKLSVKKRQKFSPEEDKIILDFYTQNGGNWKILAKKLAGRTPDMIKNRFYGTIKKRLTPEQSRTISQRKATSSFQNNTVDETSFIDIFISSELQEDSTTFEAEHLGDITLECQDIRKFDDVEKRRKMKELYSKMAILQAFISKTQSEIAQFKQSY